MISYIKRDWSLHSNCFEGDNFYNFLYIFGRYTALFQFCPALVICPNLKDYVLKLEKQSKSWTLEIQNLEFADQVLILIAEYGWGLRGRVLPPLGTEINWTLFR